MLISACSSGSSITVASWRVDGSHGKGPTDITDGRVYSSLLCFQTRLLLSFVATTTVVETGGQRDAVSDLATLTWTLPRRRNDKSQEVRQRSAEISLETASTYFSSSDPPFTLHLCVCLCSKAAHASGVHAHPGIQSHVALSVLGDRHTTEREREDAPTRRVIRARCCMFGCCCFLVARFVAARRAAAAPQSPSPPQKASELGLAHSRLQ